MRAIIEFDDDIPEFQIGQEVSVYFKDSMCIKGICKPDPIDGIRNGIRKLMHEINPSSSESDYACCYILDLINTQALESTKSSEEKEN